MKELATGYVFRRRPANIRSSHLQCTNLQTRIQKIFPSCFIWVRKMESYIKEITYAEGV